MSEVEAHETKKYLYSTIIEKIRDMIRSGDLKPGERLPPERKMAEDFGVSRNSLRQAIQAMSERRLIESRHGDGNYISASIDSTFLSDSIIDAITEQKDFLREYYRIEKWLRDNNYYSKISPFSVKIKGEIIRDRIAVKVMRIIRKLHLEKRFAEIYCNG